MIKKLTYSATGVVLFGLLSAGVALAQTASPSPSMSPSPSATVVPSAAPATGMGGR